MKKFLTVLLALSVVFTYSFSAVGTAFAADPSSSDAKTHAEAMDQAVKELTEELNKAVTDAKKKLADSYTETRFGANCVIDGSAYAAALDKLASDYTTVITIAAGKVDKAKPSEINVETLKTAIKGESVDEVIVYNNTKVATDINTISAEYSNLDKYVTANSISDNTQAYYVVYAWANALDSMKAYLNGEIAKMDLAQYTDDVADKDDPYKLTWKQKAEKAKADLEKTVADTVVSTADGKTSAENAIKAMYAVLEKLTATEKVTTVDGKVIVITYKLADKNIKTAEDLKLEGSTDAATKAELKAAIQANAAKAQKEALETYNASNKDQAAKTALETAQKNIEAYVEVNTVLIDNDIITKAAQFKQGDTANRGDCLIRVQNYEQAADLAETLKVQVEKDVSLKYIASKIDENLAAAQLKIYNANTTITEADLTKGAENESDNLAWLKEVALANVDAELADALYNADNTDKYYAPEKAKVEAKYQEWKDKINSATTVAQLDQVKNAEPTFTIDDKTAVNKKVKSYLNTAEFINAVNSYIDYLNIGIASYADGYREAVAAGAGDADVVEYLAENGARSNADVAGLFGNAEAYAKALPTRGDLKAEKAAVDALVKALPNVITLADKAAVKAAYEAAEKADYTPARLTAAIELVKNAEAKAIDEMIAALPKTLTSADKAAVDAILDAIDVYEGEAMYSYHTYAKKADATKAFVAVRKAVLTDVQNTIAALPADPTADQVKAAREAVDEFVKAYTDPSEPYQAIAMIENLDKLTFFEAQVKAKTIKAVESLKITASSVAAKGSITVKWKVVGDYSAADGMRVYKSTKKNSGYGATPYFITKKGAMQYKNTKELKKGTRYYYKVRAYVEIDGVKYYSDYSNKAYRIAK